jgi:hypothetical protein
MSSGNIDDAETPKAETDPRPHVNAVVIWAAMNDRIGHPADKLGRNRVVAFKFEDSGDSAHCV